MYNIFMMFIYEYLGDKIECEFDFDFYETMRDFDGYGYDTYVNYLYDKGYVNKNV